EGANRRGAEGEETMELGGAQGVETGLGQRRPIPGSREEVGPAVVVGVADTDADAAGEGFRISVETGDQGLAVGEVVPEDLDVRAGAGAGPSNDVGDAVAGDIARGNVNPAGEVAGVGVEGTLQGAVAALEDLDVRPGPGARPGEDVGPAV